MSGDNGSGRRALARSVGTWRRLYIVHGPLSHSRLALLIAEMAEGHSGRVFATPTHALLRSLTGMSARNVERQLAQLVASSWLLRIGARPQPGIAQSYQLILPQFISGPEIEAARSLKRGMWQALASYVMPDMPGRAVPDRNHNNARHFRVGMPVTGRRA